MKQRKHEQFTMFQSFHAMAELLSKGNMQVYGEIMFALNLYGIDGIEIAEPTTEQEIALIAFERIIDNSVKNFTEGRNGGNATAQKKRRGVSKGGIQAKEKEKEVEKEEETEKEFKHATRNVSVSFVKPTVNDIKNFCKSENINIDADEFINYYDGNGWMSGRNKMRDWKAVVRNWYKRQQQQENVSKVSIDVPEMKQPTEKELLRIKLKKNHPTECARCGSVLTDNSCGNGDVWFCKQCRVDYMIQNDEWQEVE